MTIKPLVELLDVKTADKHKPNMNEKVHERVSKQFFQAACNPYLMVPIHLCTVGDVLMPSDIICNLKIAIPVTSIFKHNNRVNLVKLPMLQILIVHVATTFVSTIGHSDILYAK